MQYSRDGCKALCKFCPQSKGSKASRNLLSRVVWPVTELDDIIDAIALRFHRACIQSVIKEGFIDELKQLVKRLASKGLKISLSVTPVGRRVLEEFKELGVDYLGVGLDAASERVANEVCKPYSWIRYLRFIRDAVEVFGRGRVVTHLIVGLGEEVKELLNTIELVTGLGSRISLFAYTPVKGTELYGVLESPNLRYYRFAQVASTLIEEGHDWRVFTVFINNKPYIRSEYVDLSKPWKYLLVRGCPGCNRPFYTESPAGVRYNYSSLDEVLRDFNRVVAELEELIT